ncbi:MAG: hypothetical protein AB1564_16045 [Chloroflexota bacterium]
MSKQEQERLRRLRDRQLVARDPLVKQRKFQHDSAVKERRMRKPFSLTKAWGELPHIVKSPFYGLVIGIVITAVLPNLWTSPWAFLVGAGLTLVFIIFGVVTGNSLDLRDRIKDNIK